MIDKGHLTAKIFKEIDFYNFAKLHELTVSELSELNKCVNYGYRKKGEKICTAGHKDDSLFIILLGKVALSVPRQD